MKIDNSGKPLNSLASRGDARAAAKRSDTEAGTAAPDNRADNVEINSFSARLASLEANLVSQPVVDESKVAEIRQAIKDGRFTVHADAIADKLIASVKELLANKN